jgi:hypothetical protein
LLYNKVGIGFAKPCPFEQTHNLILGSFLALEKDFILFGTNCAAEDDFIGLVCGESLKSAVAVVKDDFNVR